MKRSRNNNNNDATTPNTEELLGALELAAVLNGEDPRRIGDALKSFVKLVQRERRLALGIIVSSSTSTTTISSSNNAHSESSPFDSSDDDESPSSSESGGEDAEMDDATESTPKKQKRFKASESWKEDTNQYDVPFVGTNVARGGRGAVVVVGQWPTGLLQAYLERSTKAVEFTGDHLIPPLGHIHKQLLRQKQGKLSHAIYKSYLKALAELVTAAIPKKVLVEREAFYHSNLGNDAISTDSDKIDDKTATTAKGEENPSFLAAILKDRIPPLLSLLQTETKKGKGPCGPLVPLVLRILSNVAATSGATGASINHRNARTIARDIEQSIPEIVWKAALRLPPLHHNTKQQHRPDTQQEEDINDDDGGEKEAPLKRSPSTKDTKREESRTAVIQLTRTLLSSQDSTVLHYIGSPGSKDRKLSAGLLVLALRDGLRDTFAAVDLVVSPTRDAYYQEIVRLLQTLRQILYSTSSRSLYSTRRWVEIFSPDVLQNLCDLSLHAPVLSKPDLFQTVLDATDTYTYTTTTKSLSSLEVAAMEARRLLWPLLVDRKRSPLLQWVIQLQQQHQGTVVGATVNKQSGQNPANHAEQSLVRAMGRLLDTHPAPGRLAWQHCLCHGMAATPTLLPDLFQKLTVPDPNKHPFSFLARLRFISLVVQSDGTTPAACLTHLTTLGRCVVESNVDPVVRILAPSALKKTVLSKAMQSKNALLVAETLKCLICLIQRIDTVKNSIFAENEAEDAAKFWALLSAKVVILLPDLQVLLSTLSRFDLAEGDRAAPVLCGHLCQLLLSYASNLPEVILGVKFDWIKLLPVETEIFCRLPATLQVKLLRTLEALLTINKVRGVVPPVPIWLLLSNRPFSPTSLSSCPTFHPHRASSC